MAEWKSIIFKEKFVKKSGEKASLIICPYQSKYEGYSFWHPTKLIYTTNKPGILTLRYTDEFEFRLTKCGYFGNKVGDPMKVTAAEIAALDWGSDVDESELNPYETHKPEPLKPIKNPTALEELLDD